MDEAFQLLLIRPVFFWVLILLDAAGLEQQLLIRFCEFWVRLSDFFVCCIPAPCVIGGRVLRLGAFGKIVYWDCRRHGRKLLSLFRAHVVCANLVALGGAFVRNFAFWLAWSLAVAGRNRCRCRKLSSFYSRVVWSRLAILKSYWRRMQICSRIWRDCRNAVIALALVWLSPYENVQEAFFASSAPRYFGLSIRFVVSFE